MYSVNYTALSFSHHCLKILKLTKANGHTLKRSQFELGFLPQNLAVWNFTRSLVFWHRFTISPFPTFGLPFSSIFLTTPRNFPVSWRWFIALFLYIIRSTRVIIIICAAPPKAGKEGFRYIYFDFSVLILNIKKQNKHNKSPLIAVARAYVWASCKK